MKKTSVIPAKAGIKTDPRFREDDRSRKLWGGRFFGATSKAVERFTHSFSVDHRLAKHDLLGSIAHARMLGKSRIIPGKDARRLVKALQSLLNDLEKNRLRLDPAAEDVHTAIQSAVQKRAGAAAQRLHTARSRNDQVVTALRLYSREKLEELSRALLTLGKAVLSQAEKSQAVFLPGYTHLRHAQPVLASHLFLSYLEMLERDRERLSEIARRLMREMPLGSGALAGTGLPIDRAAVARELGFTGLKSNSIDAVSDRDFVVEILAALALLGVHLSRVSEELILFSTREFGFLSFSDRLLTGSSMMPQKQNPDFLELIRGGSSRLAGNLSAMLTLLKGLPSGYQRDLQLDKEILFESLDRAGQMLEILTLGFQGLRWNRRAIAEQLQDESLYATDLAEYLVQRGVPFAQAHRSVGRLLAHADRQGTSLRTLPLSVWKKFSPVFGSDAYRLLDPAASVRRKKSFGSTNPAQVARQMQRWKSSLRIASLRGANATKQSHS